MKTIVQNRARSKISWVVISNTKYILQWPSLIMHSFYFTLIASILLQTIWIWIFWKSASLLKIWCCDQPDITKSNTFIRQSRFLEVFKLTIFGPISCAKDLYKHHHELFLCKKVIQTPQQAHFYFQAPNQPIKKLFIYWIYVHQKLRMNTAKPGGKNH